MKSLPLLALLVLTGGLQLHAQNLMDRLRERLTITAFDDNIRARLSGTLDLEFYYFQKPAPGLIDAAGNSLFNPRLTLFLDAQLGPAIYFFSQARFDRHFDPSDRGAQARLDEYALRVTPWNDGRLSIQIGKFATVVGQWVGRHLSWDNPFITAPLVYENALPLEDLSAPDLPYTGELEDEKYEYISVIWGPSYASGASVAGRFWKFEYAAELKNAALSSRPESWDATRIGFAQPTVSGRLGLRPNEAWNFGFSASDGAYFRPDAAPTLPPGRDLGDYHQTNLAQDISFAWHRLQLWAEFHQTRFEIPRLGDADTFGYFLEAKYKVTPQLAGAIRWNQQFFDEVPDGVSGRVQWAHDISRLEVAAIYRVTPHVQLKLEYYVEAEEQTESDLQHAAAGQLTVRF
jgi:hypothetical protein